MSYTIIGTAGHIDHGKTVLVKALTGIDTDRLKEEKQRGMTIDLGFAFLGNEIAIIDVPGHKRFIKNMVAGVSTIDLVLFVIAADDGIMPQTREHLDILQLLQLKRGIIAVTKVDLVDREWIDLVKDDFRELVKGSFLEDSPVVEVSSVTGAGIEELRTLIQQEVSKVKEKADSGIFRIPIDRVFIMKGFGTVVTGSVISGTVKVEDKVQLLPQKKEIRIRGIQTCGRGVTEVRVGQRAALNLSGINKKDLKRGDVLATPGYLKPSYMIDSRLRLLKSAPRHVKNRSRVRLYLGTKEIMARVMLLDREDLVPGESALVQLRLEKPGVCSRLDRFVIRSYSPPATIGGGVVLDANPPKHKRFKKQVIQDLSQLEMTDPLEILERRILWAKGKLKSLSELASETGQAIELISKQLRVLEEEGRVITFGKGVNISVVHPTSCEDLKNKIRQTLRELHKEYPLLLGMKKAELANRTGMTSEQTLFDALLSRLIEEKELKLDKGYYSLYSHQIKLPPKKEAIKGMLEKIIWDEGFSTSKEEELAAKIKEDPEEVREVIGVMADLGIVERIGDLIFHYRHIKEVEGKLVAYFQEKTEMSVGDFKELVGGISRKYAIPLLNYYDSLGIIQRRGDIRVLKRRKQID